MDFRKSISTSCGRLCNNPFLLHYTVHKLWKAYTAIPHAVTDTQAMLLLRSRLSHNFITTWIIPNYLMGNNLNRSIYSYRYLEGLKAMLEIAYTMDITLPFTSADAKILKPPLWIFSIKVFNLLSTFYIRQFYTRHHSLWIFNERFWRFLHLSGNSRVRRHPSLFDQRATFVR